jgi:mono/diheme cytochrome c family protein
MKLLSTIVLSILLLAMLSCGGGGKSEIERIKEQSIMTPADPFERWSENKGIGPIKKVDLSSEIDQILADKGQEIYETKCTACHKIDKKFIGPAPLGILERRTPEWIMNMILNPEQMLAEDPMAKQLLIDYNGSPMANQNLTEEEARSVLEYFRTLKPEN